MLARIYSFYVLALPLLAAAASIVPRDGPDDHKGRPPHRPPHRPPQRPPKDGINQCNVGSISCCNSVQDSEDKSMTSLASLLGIDLGPVAGLVGLNCSPVDVAGIGGNSCTAQPVCCTNNDFNGLINIGCSPININL